MMSILTHKQCTKCHELKSLDAFSLAKSGRYGRAAECKVCHIARNPPKGHSTERAKAKQLGLDRYFTGRPCKWGHIAERYIGGNCVECAKLNPILYLANPKRKRAYKKRWDEENVEYRRAYKTLNHNRDRFIYATTRAGPACPPWADLKAIETFYLACPPGKVVDHIVAFYGITTERAKVSGLHVLWNLQYLSPIENMRKNRYTERLSQRHTITPS